MDPTFEPKLTLEPKLDFSHISESVLVTVPFILKTKSSISSNHISLLDQGKDHYDSEMLFQVWSFNRDGFHVNILHDPNQIGNNNNVRKEVIKDRFLETPHNLDWAAALGPIRPPLESPP